MVLNDLPRPHLTPDALRQLLFALAIHELSHIGEWGPAGAEPVPADLPELSLAASKYLDFEEPRDPAAERAGHGPAFARVAGHLYARYRMQAHATGFAVGLDHTQILPGGGRHLPYIGDVLESLGDEPRQLAGGPLHLIARMPPPPQFAALWAAENPA